MNLKEPHLLIYKLLGSLGKNLIEGNKEQAIEIKQELIDLNFANIVKNWNL